MSKEMVTAEDYEKLRDKYASLGASIKESLTVLLAEKGIKHLGIQSRIKSFESFKRKVENKEYTKPLEDTEDICGLRIICYYISDFNEVCKLLEKEFSIVNFVDKEEELDIDRFGYRSKHYVVTVKNDWLSVPNYRSLGNLKAEIQVRTILMHSWAEIEHKLNYKSEGDIPKPLKRKLYRLSALIEMADEQFEQVRKDRSRYVEEVTPKSGEDFDLEQEMNVDTMQAFLDTYLHHRKNTRHAVADLLKEIAPFKYSFKDILASYSKAEKYLAEASGITRNIPRDEWAQVGAIRLSLELTDLNYWNFIKAKHPQTSFFEEFEELREKVASENI